ncbi:MAG: prepilin-type N-terminal cleavage/methylation domain-containing protein [Pseudomonadota bacterium]
MPIWKAGDKSVSQGFTLLEVLLVLVLLGMVSAIVAPALNRGYQNSTLDTTTRTITSLLRYARASAIQHRVMTNFRFDSTMRSYSASNALTVSKLPNFIHLFTQDGEPIGEETALQINFYPSGTSSGGEFLIGNDKRIFRILVNPVTGRVSAEKIVQDK